MKKSRHPDRKGGGRVNPYGQPDRKNTVFLLTTSLFCLCINSVNIRLLESKGSTLQKLLSPLTPVSLLLKLSDLVFASDGVIGWIVIGLLKLCLCYRSPGRIDAPVLQLHAEDDRSSIVKKYVSILLHFHFFLTKTWDA